MIDLRRVCFPFLAAGAVALIASCSPNETAQKVSFVLDLDAERLSSIEFVVNYSSGDFAGSTGQCKVSAAAGPPDASPMADAAVRTVRVSLPRNAAAAAEARGVVPNSTSSTTNASTTTEEPPSTTTMGVDVTTTIADVTTTLAGILTCGDGVLDDGEECDDGDINSGDGCDGNCDAEFAFDSVVSGEPSHLTVSIVNGLGIAPGSTLAFCQFQGDVQSANFVITATGCELYGGGDCNPVTDAGVTDSTTTTTTTTTTTSSTTTTTRSSTTTTL